MCQETPPIENGSGQVICNSPGHGLVDDADGVGDGSSTGNGGWLEILWHCLNNDVLYNEATHVANRSRALGHAACKPQHHWKVRLCWPPSMRWRQPPRPLARAGAPITSPLTWPRAPRRSPISSRTSWPAELSGRPEDSLNVSALHRPARRRTPPRDGHPRPAEARRPRRPRRQRRPCLPVHRPQLHRRATLHALPQRSRPRTAGMSPATTSPTNSSPKLS